MHDALSTGWVVAIAVAVLPAIVSVAGNWLSREARVPSAIRTLQSIVECAAKMPENSDARAVVDQLIIDFVVEVKPSLIRKKQLNPANVALSIVLLFVTAGSGGLLINWSLTAGSWTVLAWIVTAVVGVSLLIINAASVSTWYEPRKAKEDELIVANIPEDFNAKEL